jgi:hypothetical protein
MKTDAASEEKKTPAQLAETMESANESRALDARDPHATRPLAVTAASSKEAEKPQAPLTQEALPQEAGPVLMPAQLAREHIASGKGIEPPPMPKPRGKGQRVVGAARDVVEERLAPRVERIKQASNVVWGEAQDDPNLRFILVAVFLFILAIAIILLGTYLR